MFVDVRFSISLRYLMPWLETTFMLLSNNALLHPTFYSRSLHLSNAIYKSPFFSHYPTALCDGVRN